MKDTKTFKPCDLVILVRWAIYRAASCSFPCIDWKMQISSNRIPVLSASTGMTMTISEFIDIAHKSLQEFLNDNMDDAVWERFSARLSYLKIDLTQLDQYQQLNAVMDTESPELW